MIKVYHREYYGKMFVTIEGHAMNGKKGEDVVCAGVSALVCTLINCLRDEESSGRIRLVRDIVRDGFVNLEIEFFDFAKERVQVIIETVLSGLYMISEEYPQCVVIE